MQRPHSPVDEDLQNLYNEVWASFSEEPTAPALELYNPQAARVDLDHQPRIAAAHPNGSPPYSHALPRMASSNLREPSPTSPKGGPRRLPPTPVSPATGAPPTNMMSMPEPEVYQDVSNFSHYYSDSFASTSSGSNDLRKAAAGNAANRRLPQAPAGSNGYGYPAQPSAADGPLPPLPPKPHEQQPLSRVMSYASHDSSISSATGSSFFSTNSTTATLPSRESSYRPPGTKAPSIPGHDDGDKYNRAYSPGATETPYTLHHQANPSLGRSSSALSSPSTRVNYGAPLGHSQSYNAHSPKGSIGTVHVDSPPHRNTSLSSSIGYNYQGGSSMYNESVNGGLGAAPSPPLSWNADPNNERADYGFYDQRRPSIGAPNPSEMLQTLAEGSPNVEEFTPTPDEGGEFWEDEEEDESRFINYSMLSHLAVQLRDKVPRGIQVKGSIPYPRAFTGKDIVSTIQSHIQRELAIIHGISTSDRRMALQIARSLQSQLFFYEVEWGSRVLQDGVEDVYMFLGDLEGGSDGAFEPEELPTGVITMMTRCYTPSCADGGSCYAYACPRKGNTQFLGPPPSAAPEVSTTVDWTSTVDPTILETIPESEIKRQSIIHKMITKEEQYIQDLDIVEDTFIKPLRNANPPVVLSNVDDFIEDVFGNILDLRECNRHLLEVLYVRQREQGPIVQRIGDIFLDAAMEFRLAYPTYIGHHPMAEKRLKDEIENNPEFRLFLEQCSRHPSRQGETIRLDLKHFLNRPSEHLQKYPVLLEAIQHETAKENTDIEFLAEAVEAIKRLHSDAQLRTFQLAMGRGPPGKWEWHDLVAEDVRKNMPKKDAKRQAIIFELIKGEMSYVKDLENINKMYIIPLRNAEPPIIARDKLDKFIEDVFHNYDELHEHHNRLVEKLQEIQREEHPNIKSITAPLMDAALNFRDAYMEYVPNYPIAAYKIDDEMANNLAFKTFVEQAVRHPDAHRLDMKNFINRPIPRLLRYELLLKGIMEASPPEHDDHQSIPPVIELIKALGKETEPGVFSAKQKVELWKYNSYIVFKPGEAIDMDLLDQHRSLIYSGKLLRQPESGLEWSGWSELFVLLFDNYMVMTKTKERDGVTRYNVNRRPIPLDLLTLVNFTDPPTQRSVGLLRGLRGGGERHADSPGGPGPVSPESAADSRSVFPITLHHIGRTGGTIILYAESAQARNEWKSKLEEALGLRKVVQESNKVFEVETLSAETFLIPSPMATAATPAWNQDQTFTGKVTCSVPFTTSNGRPLVAVGCAEGVWIGYRHDPRSMRRVLHLKMVTECAMLEDFGIFLVLADKSLFAYHIEALVPSSPQAIHSGSIQVPQKLSGAKDVQFFRVGNLNGRTLVVYMKKKGIESVFRVLEPVDDKINERTRAPVGFGSRLGFRSAKSEWFRAYRDFFLPCESYDVIFLKTRVVVLCAKGFELMDIDTFDSRTLPLIEDPRLPIVKRLESCRPMGMFRSKEDEFLLCYDEFGLYVDRHGDPSRQAMPVEWEGTAERVAFHAPYILIFDTRFIEIRHVETGRLAQIISGNDVRCIWDGRGAGTTLSHVKGAEDEIQEAQVHAVMNVVDGQGGARPPRVTAQNVVELIPTIPLYVPGPNKGPNSAPPPLPEKGGANMYDSRSYFSPVSPESARAPMSWR